MTKKPNILYMMMDQQKASASSFLGNSLVPSPFLDFMAEQGIAFSNVYAPSSICTPSRTSVFTGVHPLRMMGQTPWGELPAMSNNKL